MIELEDRRVNKSKNHSIILESREKLSVSGVEHVHNFNGEMVILDTVAGMMTIKGEELDIGKLNIDDGNVALGGKIDSITYSDRESLRVKSAGFFSKMFK